ncbi:MAG TPA: DUF2997 domain-containing protein [Planctomicrobium sp.]|nr:DUF2997 domain-containing protein [Planctomicrobium sp.]
MTRTIEIVVAPDGSSRVETRGYVGNACREASRLIEQALGQSVNEQLKPEFHQSAEQAEPIRQQS